MKFYNVALIASAFALAACGGDDKNTADTSAAVTPAATTDTAAAAGATTPATGSVAMAPITGTTHEVKMVGDDKGYRFEPANLTIKQGDGVKFTMVSGGPHNAAFDATIPAAGKAQLMANMPNQMAELTGPLLVNAGEAYTVSFANVAPGAYSYNCTPHLAMGMKGVITVQ